MVFSLVEEVLALNSASTEGVLAGQEGCQHCPSGEFFEKLFLSLTKYFQLPGHAKVGFHSPESFCSPFLRQHLVLKLYCFQLEYLSECLFLRQTAF